MSFIIKPFVIYETASYHYCYSDHTSAKITHPNLLKFLQYLLQNKVHALTKEAFEQLVTEHELKSDIVLRFLIENLRIFSLKNEDRFQYLYLMSDNYAIQQNLYDEFSKHYGLTVIPKTDFSPIDTEKSLIVCFNQTYKEQEFKKLYALATYPDSYFVTSFLADKYLIIDNIYNKNKGIPCHFCGTHQLRTAALTSPDLRQLSWLAFYRQLLRGGFNSFPAVPLSILNQSLITHLLGKFIKQFIDPFSYTLYQDHINEFWHINLDKNKIEKEPALHWHLCECLQNF